MIYNDLIDDIKSADYVLLVWGKKYILLMIQKYMTI